MIPLRLVLLRSYNITFGRIPIFSILLKKTLVFFLIKKSKDKYVASSQYFDYKQFEKENKSVC